MARGNVLTEDIKRLIAKVYLEHRDWRAPKIREEVIKQFHQVSQNYDDPSWPRISAVQQYLAKIRKRDDERLPESLELGSPWSTISLAKYPIPPEALPSVLQVWVWIRENSNATFTIRAAQWAARLYAVTNDIAQLAILSRGHSLLELILLITGKTSETSHNIDLVIFGKMTGQEITPERERKILGLSMEDWLEFQKVQKFIDTDEDSVLDNMLWKALKKIKEPQDERTHNQEIQE